MVLLCCAYSLLILKFKIERMHLAGYRRLYLSHHYHFRHQSTVCYHRHHHRHHRRCQCFLHDELAFAK